MVTIMELLRRVCKHIEESSHNLELQERLPGGHDTWARLWRISVCQTGKLME